MQRIIHLSENEEKALRLLAFGKTPQNVRDECTLPLAGMSVFTAEIRRKTGIQDTRHPKECREYIERYETAMAGPGLNEEELQVVRDIVKGETFTGIAYKMQKPRPDVWALYDSGCAAAGIFARDDRARRTQLRVYLATFHPVALVRESAPTLHELTFLRAFADGQSYAAIAEKAGERIEYVQFKARSLLARLGLTARGRNTQRTLARAWLVNQERQEQNNAPVDMSDPAF